MADGRRSSTLLIVDDDESSRRTLAMVLERVGYRLLLASSGEEALELAQREGPDLVLLDIKLPDRSGTEVLIELKRQVPDTAVIMVTAHASIETAVSALNQGAAAYILKPLNLDDVRATIAQLLESRRLVLDNRRLAEEVRQELKERQRAEAERDLLVTAVESAGEAIVVTDAAGTILYVNPAFEGMTGFGRQELLEGNLGRLDGGPEEEASLREVMASISGGGVWSGQRVSRHRGGQRCHVECTIASAPTVEGSSAADRFVHVRRDVTERLRLEAVAEAVNTMNSIGYVFAGIRHELGNPINSIRMALKLLKGRLDRYDRAEFERYLERMLEELSRVSFLLHSLKSFNMYERLEPRSVELEPFFEQFYQLVQNDCRQRGVTFETRVEPGGLSALADARALQQVLLNILTNALDAVDDEPGGRIGLAARRGASEVILTMTDDGVGMTEEEVTALFRPFVTTKIHGTGLGLVIAKKMMSQMQGAISVKSQRGQGTVVTLTLPEDRT